LARELASAGELLVHPGKPICKGLIAAMSAACEVFAFTPRALARQAAALGTWRLTSRLVNVRNSPFLEVTPACAR